METTTSSIVSRLGAGSGIDMVQLANDLAEVRYAPQIEQLQTRNEALEARISAASTLRNQLTQLASALGDRIRTGDLSPAPQLGNPAVAQAKVISGFNPTGSYQLEVTQLARSQTLVLPAYTSGADLIGEGTFTLRFGTVDGTSFAADADRSPVEITVTTTDTLASLAGKINAADSGVTAYVTTGTSGAQLVLKGVEGAANGFVVETVSSAALPAASPGDLTYLGWDPASNAGQLRQGALDAQFKLDTVAMSSASNAVTGLTDGLTLQLTGTNTGAPTTISFADRSSAISGLMNDFVAALNDITSQLGQSAAALGGELGNDPGARALKRALAGLATEVIMPSAAEGEPRTLGDLGLRTNRDGSLAFDSTRLAATLSASPAGAAAMFTTGLFGVYATIDDLARTMASRSDPGALGGSIARYTSLIARNDERAAKFAEQQDALRERMVRQFAAADRAVSASNSTLSYIRSQIAVWNAEDN
jgi:flagellar hook-associated protein 2